MKKTILLSFFLCCSVFTFSQVKTVVFKPDSILNIALFNKGTFQVIDSTGKLVPSYKLSITDSIVTETINNLFTINSKRKNIGNGVYFSTITFTDLPNGELNKGDIFHSKLISTDTKNKIIQVEVLTNTNSKKHFLYKID